MTNDYKTIKYIDFSDFEIDSITKFILVYIYIDLSKILYLDTLTCRKTNLFIRLTTLTTC